MEKNEKTIKIIESVILIANAILFGILFYQQSYGLNYLIFSSVLGISCIFLNFKELHKKWYLALFINILCAYNIYNVNSHLAIWAWVFSLIFLIGNTSHLKKSFLLTSFFSIISPISAFEKIFNRIFIINNEKQKSNKLLYVGAFLISFIIILIFFFLYKGANPLFDNFTNSLDLSWLDFPFIMFCLLGFWIVFFISKPYVNLDNLTWDNDKISELKFPELDQKNPKKQFLSIIAIMVFIALNIMLISLNILDIKSIYILEKLPKNIFLSDFLHFSVWSIVFSIILAILLIIGIQQFKIENKFIKILCFLWIFQSFVMVTNTITRNYWYSFNQITYLRIGVFVFLTLSILGLIYTAYIIFKRRNYWFLLNLNLNTWFITLIITSFFSWDRLITNYNLSYQKKNQIDIEYLLNLSDKNTDLMLVFYQNNKKLFDDSEQYIYMNEKEKMAVKYNNFIKKMKKSTWQSHSRINHEILNNINAFKNEK